VDTASTGEWECPFCDHRVRFEEPVCEGLPARVTLRQCLVCGNCEIYKKKGFPHWLGLSVLTLACAAFLVLNGLYLQWLGWAVLLGSAVFDGLLYLWVHDVLVCYRCHAHYSGAQTLDEHKPFELVVGERYRQQRLRQGQRGLATRAKGPQ
jgi:hypothetical protein